MKDNNSTLKQLSNSASTGGLGNHFENLIQTAFTVLMLTDTCPPTKTPYPIYQIKLQGKYQGFETDDMIIYTEDPLSKKQSKLLCQIKCSIKITKENKTFKETLQAAWFDFNKKDFFNKNTDSIVLITGPLAEIDTIHTRRLLNQAKYAEDAQDFNNRIYLGNFTSNQQRQKLDIFKSILKEANENQELSDDELWGFLKSFYILIYDLDEDVSNFRCLFQSLLQLSFEYNSQDLWAKILDCISYYNENSGLITKESIYAAIPNINPYVPTNKKPNILNLNFESNLILPNKELVIAVLIGSWDEHVEADKKIVANIANETYDVFIGKLRDSLYILENPLSFNNGKWHINNRKELLNNLSDKIFDDYLDCFKASIVTVLSESDPQFELPKDKRFMANIYNKTLTYSNLLRKGLSEGLILLTLCNDLFKYSTVDKARITVASSIRKIFEKNDATHWGSLNDVLPLLAEACPDEFIDSIELTFLQTPSPFVALFNEESSGFTGRNYMTGLLWALECIAWDERYLNQVTLILGKLAILDPGGNWANRPIRSLISIFLTWLPQTLASFEKRKITINQLKEKNPVIAWNLILNLLPNRTQTSTGSYKPIYRHSTDQNLNIKITNQEYWEQMYFYLELSIELAKDDISKLDELISYIPSMPEIYLNQFLDSLTSDKVLSINEDKRFLLWNKLSLFILKHKRHSTTDWALSPALIAKIEQVAKKLEPENPLCLYYPLFSEEDFNLYESNDDNNDREKQHSLLETKRKKALEYIIEAGNFETIIQFVQMVNRPYVVGSHLAMLIEYSFDSKIFPDFLLSKNRKIQQFINYYILNKHKLLGWNWVNTIDMQQWSIEQIVDFYIALPFSLETWRQIELILVDKKEEYWRNVNVNPYQTDSDLDYAISNLIHYGRPHAAIDCIVNQIFNKQPVDSQKAISALLESIQSKEGLNSINSHHILELIEYLQKDSSINQQDLLNIEWSYLPLISPGDSVKPKTLENQLANSADFFCEIVQLLYRSKNIEATDRSIQNKNHEFLARNAWNLLHNWHIPPGMQKDGTFDDKQIKKWVDEVIEKCKETGHLEVSMIHIGHILFYCPKDQSGFWINKTAAKIIDDDANHIRNGFYSQTMTSRGAHFVNPSGIEEKELAEKYRKRAQDTQDEGFINFANILYKIAESYDSEAKDIITRHNQDNNTD